MKTLGEQTITVTDASTGISANLNGAGSSIDVQNVAEKLVFTVGADQTFTAGQTSSLITVQRQDVNGNPCTVGWNLVYLNTQSPSGNFYYTNGSLMAPYSVMPYGTALIQPSILIPQGASSASFYYEDGNPGSWTLTATSDGDIPYIPAGATLGIQAICQQS